ncbi:MAG: DMT family transporter [Proteobacteria bacterium]|nr:DMT family transporter [Pseudomonadota bacterium]
MGDATRLAAGLRGLRTSLLPVALLLALGSLWGLTPPFGKLAAEAGIPPLGFIFWQSLGAFLVLLAVSWRRGRLPPLKPGFLGYYLATGTFGLWLPNMFALYALRHIPAGVMSVEITTVPFITYALSLAVGIERAELKRTLGIALGFAGALMIVLPKGSLPTAGMALWAAMGFLTPTIYALTHIIVARFRPEGADSLALAAGMMAGSALGLAPAMALSGSFFPLWSASGFAAALVLAQALVTGAAFVVYFALMRRAGPVYSSQASYVVTLTGIAWGIGLFGERYSAWIWAAATLVLAGLALVNLSRRGAGGG